MIRWTLFSSLVDLVFCKGQTGWHLSVIKRLIKNFKSKEGQKDCLVLINGLEALADWIANILVDFFEFEAKFCKTEIY